MLVVAPVPAPQGWGHRSSGAYSAIYYPFLAPRLSRTSCAQHFLEENTRKKTNARKKLCQSQALPEFVFESPGPYCIYPLAVDTTGRMYDEFIRLLFWHAHLEASVLTNELTEESDQFHFLHSSCFTNLKWAVGLIMTKTSTIRISIPLDLSSRPCVPLQHFIRSRRPTPLLDPSLVLFPPRSV